MTEREPAEGTPKEALKTTIAYVLAILAGIGLLFVLWVYFARPTWADEGSESLKKLDSEDAAVRAAALDDLKKAPDRDVVVVHALRDEAIRKALGPHALETLADLVGELDLRFADSGLRAVVADSSAPLPARKAAARSLAKTGGIADVSALGDAVLALPEEASKALVAIGGSAARNALKRGGGDDPPLDVCAGLASLGDPSGLPRLVAALKGPDAARAASLLRQATGRDLPPDPAAWEALLRRRVLAERFADLDNAKAGDFVDEVVAKLKKGDAFLADDLVGILKDATYPATARDKAALALGLGDVRTQAAKEALVWACRSDHFEKREVGSVRIYAAGALARVGDLSCAPALIAMLNNDEDEDRIAARRTGEGDFYPVDPCLVRALLRIGCRGAVDRAIDLIAGEYRTRLHRDCLRVLAEVSDDLDFGFQPDASKPERQVVVTRIRAWWREAREQLALAPKPDDPGWDAFKKTIDENITTLGGFKFLYQMRAKNLLIDLAEPAFPQLVAALSNENEHVRMGLADVFANAALRDAAKPLAERLKVETNRAVKTRILAALEICGRPFTDGKPSVPPVVAEAVRGALADRDLDVRIAAARTLGVVGELTADLARLDAAKADPSNSDDAFRFAACAAEQRLAYQKNLPELVVQLRSDDAALRTEAAKTLSAAGVDLRGYDADVPPSEREAAIRRMLMPGLTGGVLVPYRERK